jgi:hypothetical protein
MRAGQHASLGRLQQSALDVGAVGGGAHQLLADTLAEAPRGAHCRVPTAGQQQAARGACG